MAAEKGNGDTGNGTESAGRASGFEVATVDMLRLGNGQYHAGPTEKGFGQVIAVPVDNPGRAGQDRVSVAADQVGGRSGGGQSAQLFRADGYPVAVSEFFQAVRTGFALAVISGTQSGEAGADQVFA